MNNNLKQELAKIDIPIELHEKSKMGVKQAKSEMESKIKRHLRKRLILAVLVAFLTITTSAFAYQTLLVDELYGSFENLKKHISSATMEGYLTLNAKLTQAKGEIEQKEFERFKELLKVITTSKIEYGDKYGNIDYSQVPSDRLSEIKQALFEIQPYFDLLNGQKSSKEVLTSEEYMEYIDALMTYEEIMVKSKIKGPNEIEKIPSDLQEEFIKARDFLRYVDDKQRQ